MTVPTLNLEGIAISPIPVRTISGELWTVSVTSSHSFASINRSSIIAETTRAKALTKFRDANFKIGIIQGPVVSSHPRRDQVGSFYSYIPEERVIRQLHLNSTHILGIGYRDIHYWTTTTLLANQEDHFSGELYFQEPLLIRDREIPVPVSYPGYSHDPNLNVAARAAYYEYRRKFRTVCTSYQRQMNECIRSFDQYLEQLNTQGIIRVVQFNELLNNNAAGPTTT